MTHCHAPGQFTAELSSFLTGASLRSSSFRFGYGMTVRGSFEFSSAGEAIPAPAIQYLIDQVIRYCVIAGDEAVAVLAFQDLKFRRSNIRHNRFYSSCSSKLAPTLRRRGNRTHFVSRLVALNDSTRQKFRNSTGQKDANP
jgi:hypothetical protein